MTDILRVLIILTLFIVKFSQGLNTTIKQLTYLKNRPRLLRRSLIAVDILVPIITYLIVTLIKVPSGIAVGMLLVAACPGAPLTTRKIFQKGGIFAYGASLHMIVVLLSVITTPITLWLLFLFTPLNIKVNIFGIFKQIIIAQLIPLGLGMFVRAKFSALANKIEKPLTQIGNLTLLVTIVVIVIVTFRFVLQINFISLLAIILGVSSFLAIGHLMGGRHPQRRHTLALVCASRNIGLAAFIASLNFPINLILPNLIPYLFFAAIVEIIYMKILKTKKFSSLHLG